MANIKLRFVPEYATAKTIRFAEVVEAADALGPDEPVFGTLYFQKPKLRELGWKGTLGAPYEAPGTNGRTFTRQDILGGDDFTVTITKNDA